jgi:hypothetical protein
MSVWVQLPGWAKRTIVAALVGLFFAEVRNVIVWLVEKCQASTDRKVKELLSSLDPGENTTVVALSKASTMSEKKVRASLNRLDDKHEASQNKEGQWQLDRRYVAN